MKSLFKKILLPVVAFGLLTACEDVSAPYYLLQKVIEQGIILEESFSNGLGKWVVYNEETEGYEWTNQYNTAYISGYQNQVNKATKSWLVSPAIDLSNVESAYVSFQYVLRYKRSTTKEVLRISSDYNGDPAACHWVELDIPLKEGSDYTTFFTAGANIPDEFIGQAKVYVALYYEATEKEASTWEVKNLCVKEGIYEGEKPEEVDAIFYSTFLGEEAGFKAEALTLQGGSTFQVWKNSSQYGWIATAYDADRSSSENRIYYDCECWLISPEIKLPEGDSYLQFMHALNYKNHEGLGVYIAVVDEENPTGASSDATDQQVFNWKELDLTWPPGNNWTYISSDDILLSEYGGHTIRIAFKYKGYEEGCATWEIKNFGIYEGTGQPAVELDLEGSGVKDDPYTVADALLLITEGQAPAKDVFVKGIISKIDDIGNTFGNATYYISDEISAAGTPSNSLEVYRGFGLGGEQIKTSDYIKVGDEVIVVGQLVYYNNKTPEFTQGNEIYSLNGKTSEATGGDYASPIGTGTKEDPYNVSATVELIDRVGNNASDLVYTKGVISRIGEINTSYGNATYYIKDEGYSGELEVYRGYGLGGEQITSNDYLKVGDEVIVSGRVIYYNNRTREFTQGSQIFELNGDRAAEEKKTEPTGSGTLEDPYNAEAANQAADRLANGAKSEEVYIKGKVVSIKEQYGIAYGNATFYISDDGTTTSQFYVFRALYLGNKKYESGTLLAKGDEVIICGKLTKYGTNNVLETAQNEAYLYSLNGDTGGAEPPTPAEVGTYDNPWTVADVQTNYKDSEQIKSYVTGYIVGYVKGSKYAEGALFSSDALEAARAASSAPSNILISTTTNVTSVDDCIPMALPTGEIRNALNLKDHPELLGTSILVYGSVEKYFQVAGLKSPSYVEYEINDPTGEPTTATIGTRPDAAKKRYSIKRK